MEEAREPGRLSWQLLSTLRDLDLPELEQMLEYRGTLTVMALKQLSPVEVADLSDDLVTCCRIFRLLHLLGNVDLLCEFQL